MSGADLHGRFAKLQQQTRLAYAEFDWESLVKATAELSDVAQALRDTEENPNT